MGMSKRTALLSAVIVTFGLGTLYLGLFMKTPRPPVDHHSWDILIFTQTWPNTLCYTWKGSNAAHKCNLPSDKNIWTVHGIWPTKLGTEGPGFCNKSLVFNPDSIFGIKNELDHYWTDIEIPPSNVTEGNSSSVTHKKQSIWFHEWEKHGTCAATLPALNSEFKYFYQGIEWSEKYNMREVLDKSNIKLNNTILNVADYWKAVKSVLKTNAWIECVFTHDKKEQMLSEIRVCFDKTLKLIDCDGIMKSRRGSIKKSHPLTNCDTKKPILYLDYVPEQNISTSSNSTSFNSTNSNSTDSMTISTDAILTEANSTVDEHPKLLNRLKRKVSDHSNEWLIKSWSHINKSRSHHPRTNTSTNHKSPRTYPRIQRNSGDWDILIFTQSWPYSFCHSWTANSNTHTCNLPVNRNQWTIHGIWPSKIGGSGPFFCDNYTIFHRDSLNPIMTELHTHWTELKRSRTWTWRSEGDQWKHEWLKHGSCARSLPALNTELKYFKKGIEWSKKYELSEILSRGHIVPNAKYPIGKFWHTLRTELGKNPRINCHVESDANNTKSVHIDEVRICFDKSLSLVDCDPLRITHNKPFTNCPLYGEVNYVGADRFV